MKPFPHSKLQGEWVEVCFVAECLRRGMVAAKPYGDSTAYDFIIEAGRGIISRVQVKSVSVRNPPSGIYHVAVMRSVALAKKPYCAGDFDVLAAYIIPLNVWYIIPAYEVVGIKMISLRPVGRSLRVRRLEKYRDAWNLLNSYKR